MIISPLCGTQQVTSFLFVYMIISPLVSLSLTRQQTTFSLVCDYQPLSVGHNNKALFLLPLLVYDYQPHKIRTQQVTSFFVCIWLIIVIIMIICPIIFGHNNKPLFCLCIWLRAVIITIICPIKFGHNNKPLCTDTIPNRAELKTFH